MEAAAIGVMNDGTDAATPPCNNCDLREICLTKQLACKEFYDYTQLKFRRSTERIPTRELFDAMEL